VLCRAFIKSGTLATREPHSLCTGSGKRPDGVTQVPWSRGRCLAWDATCPDTFAVSHVLASSTRAGSAAATAEALKSQKYADITTGVDFFPFCDPDIGNLGRAALSPRHGDRPPTSNCDLRTTVNSVSPSASFVRGGSARQRLLRDGDISALGLSGH